MTREGEPGDDGKDSRDGRARLREDLQLPRGPEPREEVDEGGVHGLEDESLAPGPEGPVPRPDALEGGPGEPCDRREKPGPAAVVGIGVGDEDGRKVPGIPEAEPGEGPEEVVVVDPEAGIHHEKVARRGEEVDGAAARGLEAGEGEVPGEGKPLHVHVKALSRGLPEGFPGGKDALKHGLRVLAPPVELLDDVVHVVEEPEEEGLLPAAKEGPEILGEPEVEDGVVQGVPSLHGLENLDPVPGFQPVEEAPGHRPVLEGHGHHEAFRAPARVIEIGKGDVRPCGRGMAEELVEGPGPVREVDGDPEQAGGGQGCLEESLLPEALADPLLHPLIGRYLKEDRAGIDPPVVMDPVDVPVALRDDGRRFLERPGLVRHPGNKEEPLLHPPPGPEASYAGNMKILPSRWARNGISPTNRDKYISIIL